MTTDRGEIVLEGTADGRTWREYRFRHKPADPARAPAFVGVHMPRLDWQMWFAALDDWRRAGWLHALVRGILRGQSAALALLDGDPFAGGPPPRSVRTRFLRYRFTSRAERAATGAWWTTEPIGAWSPAFVLDERGELALAR